MNGAHSVRKFSYFRIVLSVLNLGYIQQLFRRSIVCWQKKLNILIINALYIIDSHGLNNQKIN